MTKRRILHICYGLPDRWTLREVRLDSQGKDIFGWYWGTASLPLWHASDGIDSLTVRARSPQDAYDTIIALASWPPKLTGRVGWGREYDNSAPKPTALVGSLV